MAKKEDAMTRRQLERALRDKSISDKEFFKMLLKYFEEQGAKMQESKSTSIHSRDFKKLQKTSADLSSLIQALRPAVNEMVRKLVLKQHEYCCGPKSKK